MAVTGLILAGGRSVRMGRDKALMPLAGRPLLAHVIDAVRPVVDELLLSVGPELRYTHFGVRTALDEWRDSGPLAGLHAGLRAAAGERVLTVGCDMPYLSPAVLRRLLEWADGFDAVVPFVNGEYEPMLAVYRPACLPAIEAALASGRRRMVAFLEAVRVRRPSEAELRELDPGLRSLSNWNTPADVDAAGA